MKVLLLGSGGREHAISWKLAQSSQLEQLYIAPGNAGTREIGINVDLSVNDFKAIKEFVIEKRVGMVVVGPEDPLVNGIHDFFLNDPELKNISVIGPKKRWSDSRRIERFCKGVYEEIQHSNCKIPYGNF